MRATATSLDFAAPAAPVQPPPAALLAISRPGVNINPVTGLACDYLNHFNEAIMLLELLTAEPEHVDAIAAWRPLSYRDHFAASRFADRETVLLAYESADPAVRHRLDEVANAMTDVLAATRDELRGNHASLAVATLAERAAALLKPLVARAGAVINGTDDSDGEGPGPRAQARIDALLDR
jgi:hypothetical protein